MSKVLEETWYVHEDTAGEPDVYRSPDPDTMARVLASDGIGPEDRARARLAAAAPDAIRLLMEAEWAGAGTGGDPSQCPWCGREPWTTTERLNPERHEKTCRLVAVLRKAGVIE